VIEVGTLLPRAHEALVPVDKFERYILNAAHERGRDKARVFRAALAITLEDAEFLRAQIEENVRAWPVTRVDPGYEGTQCEVRMPIVGRNDQERIVITGWRVPDDGSPPHFCTAYVDM
jgi:hypothetical protein